MPSVNVTPTSAAAFVVPSQTWGYVLRNNSDVTLYLRVGNTVATSGDNMGMPLDPGCEKTVCFAAKLVSDQSIFAIHGGSGNKALVYDIVRWPIQAVYGGGQSSTLIASDLQIGAMELKNGSDDTRAKVGAVSGLAVSDNGLPVAAKLFDIGEGDYETVAASASDQALGATGATGDYLSGLLIVPATTSPGAVSIKDGSGSAITVFTGGASSVSNLVPFFIPLGIKSGSGAWKVTTGANVSAIGVGNFT